LAGNYKSSFMLNAAQQVFSFITRKKLFDRPLQQPAYLVCFGVDGYLEYKAGAQEGNARIILVRPKTPFVCKAEQGGRVVYTLVDIASELRAGLEHALGEQEYVVLDELAKGPLPVHADNINEKSVVLMQELTDWFRHHFGEEAPVENRQGVKLQQIFDYVNSHIKEKITIAGIAAHIGLSLHRTRHFFSEKTGVPLIEYVLWRKVLGVAVSMRDKPGLFRDTCAEYAFSNHSHCIRRFKAFFHTTPMLALKNYTLV
jgi:AraC-like DNA-binding protein